MQTLSEEEAGLWHAWKIAGEAVMARVERDLTDQAGLSGPDFGVLSRLIDLGGGSLRQQQLADSMRWDKSRLSHQLTRMEGRGLVRRQPGEARSVIVSITAAGKKAITTARPVHARSIRHHLLARIGHEEFATFRTICERLAASSPSEDPESSDIQTPRTTRPAKPRP